MKKTIDGSILANRILKSRQNMSYCGATVCGFKGSGKSSYSLQVAKMVNQAVYGLPGEDAWQMALKNCMFSIPDVIRVLKGSVDKDEIIPVCIFDDASVHAGSMMYFLDMRMVNELRSVFETIRTSTNSMLITCCDRDSLLGFLRKSDDLLIQIVRSVTGGYDRISRGYSSWRLPSGRRMISKQFEEEFSVYIPDHIYTIYFERRKRYLREALRRMEDLTARGAKSEKYSKYKQELEEMAIDAKIQKLRNKGIAIGGEEI